MTAQRTRDQPHPLPPSPFPLPPSRRPCTSRPLPPADLARPAHLFPPTLRVPPTSSRRPCASHPFLPVHLARPAHLFPPRLRVLPVSSRRGCASAPCFDLASPETLAGLDTKSDKSPNELANRCRAKTRPRPVQVQRRFLQNKEAARLPRQAQSGGPRSRKERTLGATAGPDAQSRREETGRTRKVGARKRVGRARSARRNGRDAQGRHEETGGTRKVGGKKRMGRARSAGRLGVRLVAAGRP